MGICRSTEDFLHEKTTPKAAPMRARLVPSIPEDKLRKVLDDLFTSFDANGDNFLDLREVEAMMSYAHRRKNAPSAISAHDEALSFMREADKKRDGRIDREEFFWFYKEH
jgi:hypothetical protein